MGIPYAEVIGDPVDHSKSPLIHNFWLRKLDLNGEYRAVHVRPEELPAYLASRRADPDWRGCNVTMPLKQAAGQLVDDVDPSTHRVGALNTIIRYEHDAGFLLGANTDWLGVHFSLDLKEPPLGRVAIIGTGGAARAALEEMRQAKVRHVILISRSLEKGAPLLSLFGLNGEVLPLGSAPRADLLINASPLGMTGFPPLELDLSALPPEATVFDMVYEPLETELLTRARERGHRVIDGLTMLINQASMAFTYFFKESPEDIDYKPELRELLTR